MKTLVILDGAMGGEFGKEWELYVSSPAEALRMIAANRPDFTAWIRDNLVTYDNYEVTCEHANGVVEAIGAEEIEMFGNLKTIRFTPIAEGSGGNGTMTMIIGAVILIVAAAFTFGVGAIGLMALEAGVMANIAVGAMVMGAGMILQGVVGMLTPQPSMQAMNTSTRVDKTSYYFNGPSNTTAQGVPVQLIYGKCLVGSHAISASLTVDSDAASTASTTSGDTPISIVTFLPGKGAANVTVTSDIVITFNRDVIPANVGSGADKMITLRKDSANGEIVETFQVAGVWTSGGTNMMTNSTTLTLNPADDLLFSTEYFVILPPSSFRAVNNITEFTYVEYQGMSSYSFTTEAQQ